MTERHSENRSRPRLIRQGGAYQGALEAVFAILIGVGFGYFVDQQFGTTPIFLFVGVVVGFAAFVLRIVRLGRQLQPPATEAPGTKAPGTNAPGTKETEGQEEKPPAGGRDEP